MPTKKRTRAPVDPDQHAIRELKLYVENDGVLYQQQTVPIMKNLLKKIRAGNFDVAKAAKAYGYLVEAGAKKYQREMGDGRSWAVAWPVAVRRVVAQELAEDFAESATRGEFDELLPLKPTKETWRVHFSAWGATLHKLKIPAFAVQEVGETPIESVIRAIGKKSRMDRGSAHLDSKNSDSLIYQVTLGRSCRRKGQCDQGWSPEAEIWIAIPRELGDRTRW